MSPRRKISHWGKAVLKTPMEILAVSAVAPSCSNDTVSRSLSWRADTEATKTGLELLGFSSGRHICMSTQEQASNNNWVKAKTTASPYPPYSPDIASCDFRIFPELARRLQDR
ncbi:hypothetical protein TNCV_370171 [Trichonephila clavipes]|nr:hypothetical protein TNCV_370171 [Trichonephila clavipes]